WDVVIDPRLLHLVQHAVLRETFDGRDLPALGEAEWDRAGAHWNSVDVDRAGAALGDATAVFRAGETDGLTQYPQERGVGIDVDCMTLAVNGECRHAVDVSQSVPRG